MKIVIEILKKVRKKFNKIIQTYFGMHVEEFVEKILRNFRKIMKRFIGNF